MRFGKQKRHRKTVRFFTACFGFREPYKVLCDGTFVHHLLVNHIMPADTAVSTTLGGPVKMFTTGCVLGELKSLGRSHSETLTAASNLPIARCDHEKRKPADECIKEIIGKDNHEHFFVATQDDKLRKKFHEVPAVPLMYGLRNALYLENPSAFQRNFAKLTEEERSHISQAEYKILMGNHKSRAALEEPTERPDADEVEGHQTFGEHLKASSGRKKPLDGGSGVQFKRKKPKGPNPLSCKKRKDQMQANSGSKKERTNKSETSETLRSRKRKRSRKSQTASSSSSSSS